MRCISSLIAGKAISFFGNLVFVGLLLGLVSLPASAQSNLGAADQGQIKTPDNYTTWTPPAQGATFNDAAYGTPLKRISNGLSQFNDGVRHETAYASPFNRDNTRLLLNREGGGFVARLSRLPSATVPPGPRLPR